MADEKEVAYYAAKANAWFNTKLECDKSLLVLSAGAIGLLVTILTTVGVESVALLYVFGSAILSFVVCLFSVIAIFSRNAKHLENLIAGRVGNDSVLAILDSVSVFSFVMGVILASIIGLSTATSKVIRTEAKMAEEIKSSQNPTSIQESFNKAHNIAPQGVDTAIKSFNGAQNVAPPKTEGTTASSTGGAATQGQGSGGTSNTNE